MLCKKTEVLKVIKICHCKKTWQKMVIKKFEKMPEKYLGSHYHCKITKIRGLYDLPFFKKSINIYFNQYIIQ